MISMKTVIIIHGWGGNPDEPLLVWIDQELRKKGWNVIRPAMPNPEEPVIEDWVAKMHELADIPTEQTYFVGHSIGCQAIMRYLATLPETTAVGRQYLLQDGLILHILKNMTVQELKKSVGRGLKHRLILKESKKSVRKSPYLFQQMSHTNT